MIESEEKASEEKWNKVNSCLFLSAACAKKKSLKKVIHSLLTLGRAESLRVHRTGKADTTGAQMVKKTKTDESQSV